MDQKQYNVNLTSKVAIFQVTLCCSVLRCDELSSVWSADNVASWEIALIICMMHLLLLIFLALGSRKCCRGRGKEGRILEKQLSLSSCFLNETKGGRHAIPQQEIKRHHAVRSTVAETALIRGLW